MFPSKGFVKISKLYMDDSASDKINLLFLNLKLIRNNPVFKPNLFIEFSVTIYDKSTLLLVKSFLSFM